MKRQVAEWEEKFASCLNNKELLQINKKKTILPPKKLGKSRHARGKRISKWLITYVKALSLFRNE